MNKFISRNFPPGYSHKKEIVAFLVSYIFVVASVVWAFLYRFFDAKQRLYTRFGIDMILDVDKVMPDFVDFLSYGFSMLLHFALIVFIFVMVAHYLFFYHESKNIYLMRRLPNGSELYKRCLIMPLIFAFIFILTAIIILLIFYFIYMKLTPAACLAPNQWEKIWRSIK
ncbi:MAG: hypothetical protein FWG88_01360 [Oscillospiraceae bacterium]|nr:hypothetical protein [Oscillospiraceae bacterium]